MTFPRLIRKLQYTDLKRTFVFRTWELKLVQPMPRLGGITMGGVIELGGEDVSLPVNEGRVLEEAHARVVKRLL